MYDDPSTSSRFLVADETGLGKSVVARGVIAEAIERLLVQDEVNRIDIVYVCSNADIAAQNLSRLNVVGNNRLEFRTRLTLLARQAHDLNSSPAEFGKPVNLVAFTPATSFEKGWRTGKAEERALICALLEQAFNYDRPHQRRLRMVLQGGVQDRKRFEAHVDDVAAGQLDQTIARAFAKSVRRHAAHRQLDRLHEDIGKKWTLTADLKERCRELTGDLRTLLAQASVHALEPDLIILDEFQRFRHLLDLEDGGPAAELAHHLFDWPDAKTLLLSATPYKPYTTNDEDDSGEDHYKDFFTTLRFLSSGDDAWLHEVRDELTAFRDSLLSGGNSESIAARLRELLLLYMCRTERPRVEGAHVEVATPARPVKANDLVDFAALRELGRVVGAPVQVEYWKSAPYFANFLDGYQIGEKLKIRLKRGDADPDLDTAVARLSALDPGALARFEAIDMGNARLRSLAERTVEQGWWQLLWIPPSLPYTLPEGPYAERFAQDVTKQLVFSSWSATPTSIAGLLSYSAERLMALSSSRLRTNTAEARRRLATLLDYRLENGRPGAMTTLALFWPHPALAALADPLAAARVTPSRVPESSSVVRWAYELLAAEAGSSSGDETRDDVAAFFGWPGIIPDGSRAEAVEGMSGSQSSDGLRSLFNRQESTFLLTHLYPEVPYWQAVLTYSRAGNLQAAVDEYLHHVRSNLGDESLDDDTLWTIAEQAVSALALRPSRYAAFDPNTPEQSIPLLSRFALRYGSARAQQENVRMPEVRAAFNSPFWPFVLASTSVGQEGIDFHWWCHSVVHWNTPASPVDFEQREGRVNRFGGHAIRRNVAEAHRADILQSTDRDPWKAAYDAARNVSTEIGDFSPYWVYPGRHAVQRHLLPFPLSKDGPNAEVLKRDLVHYRLALGQPRQEDLLGLLQSQEAPVLGLDLTP
jgi:hypothetical protein